MVDSSVPEPRSFYTQTLPQQFERALRAQERAVEAAQRLLDGMRSAHATICVQVDGERFILNLESGKLSVADVAAHPPLLTLIQDRAGYERLVRDAGGSPLGLLGAISGLSGELPITRARIEALANVKGCLRFEVAGEQGFSLTSHFGPDPIPGRPDACIRFAAEVYDELVAGRLDAQSAFLSGRIHVEGDVQLAMQVALAALTPD